MVERLTANRLGGMNLSLRNDVLQLHTMLGALVEVEDTGTAGAVTTIRHGLQRCPRGLVVVQTIGTAPEAWWREADDAEWTSEEMAVRFAVGGCRVLCWVF